MFSKWIIFTGVVITAIGIVIFLAEKSKIFPLPGDILIKKEGLTIYIPITTSLLLSLILTIIFYLFRK